MTEQPQPHRQVKRKAEDQECEPDRLLVRRRRIQSNRMTIDTGAGVCGWLDASDDAETDVNADGRGGAQAPDDPEVTCDGRGGAQAPDDAAADVQGRGGTQAPDDAKHDDVQVRGGARVGGTKRTEGRSSTAYDRYKRHKVASEEVPCASSSKRLRVDEAGFGQRVKCEHFFIGDPEPIVTRYRVRKKSRPGELFKREGE